MPKLSRRRLLAASVPAHRWRGGGAALRGPARPSVGRRGAGRPSTAATAAGRRPPRPRRRARELPRRPHGRPRGQRLRPARDPARLRLGHDARASPSGRVVREWELVAVDKEIEVAPGVRFAAWTYNGRIPGPTLRCREGELLRITFVNGSEHPHTIHFHGIHPSAMDGVPGLGAGRDRARAAHGLRVRRAAGRPAPLPLPRPAARRAHRQGAVRRVHRRPGGRPRGRRRDGHGHERVRHELRPGQRGLRRQHDRLRLHGHADRGPAGTSSSGSTSSTSSSTT